MKNIKINYQFIIILFCFKLAGCLLNRNINIIHHIKYNNVIYKCINTNEVIHSAKYIPYSENIIIHGKKEVEGKRQSYIYIYNIKNQTKRDISNILENIDFLDIIDCYFINENNLLILVSIDLRSNKEHLLRLIIFDVRNKSILSEKDINSGLWFEKQSLSNRNLFFNNHDGNYYRQIIKIIDSKPITIEVTNENIPNGKIINSTKIASDICDGIDEKTFFYSILNVNNPKNYYDDRNIIVLYNWKKNEVIEEIPLPDYFHMYLKGNTIDINLSKDKRFLLFGHWPYGLWVYNLDNKTIYEICNTKYNWSLGFGKIYIHFCDWSWEGNKILLYLLSVANNDNNLIDGLYEVDLDKIDELNLKKIE